AAAAAGELLLDLVEARLDVRLGHLAPELRGLLLVLAGRDQELGRVRAQIGQLDRAGLRERVVGGPVVLLGLLDQRVPVGLLNRAVADDRDSVARDVARTASTT